MKASEALEGVDSCLAYVYEEVTDLEGSDRDLAYEVLAQIANHLDTLQELLEKQNA